MGYTAETPETVVRVTPTKVVATLDVAGWPGDMCYTVRRVTRRK